MIASVPRTAVILLTMGYLSITDGHSQSGLDQRATVFIRTECEDQKNGAISEDKGSGFIVEKNGYIVTAHHVISCFDPVSGIHLKRRGIFVRVGSPHEPPDREANLTKTDEQSDVAILKITGLPRDYPTLKLCSFWNPPSGLWFVAAGFPESREYQPVYGIIGNSSAEGGRWSVASDIAVGMSGGPVVHDGFVVGIVKGGLKDVTAVRIITPIHKAASLIEAETGQRVPRCRPLSSPRAWMDALQALKLVFSGEPRGAHIVEPDKAKTDVDRAKMAKIAALLQDIASDKRVLADRLENPSLWQAEPSGQPSYEIDQVERIVEKQNEIIKTLRSIQPSWKTRAFDFTNSLRDKLKSKSGLTDAPRESLQAPTAERKSEGDRAGLSDQSSELRTEAELIDELAGKARGAYGKSASPQAN